MIFKSLGYKKTNILAFNFVINNSENNLFLLTFSHTDFFNVGLLLYLVNFHFNLSSELGLILFEAFPQFNRIAVHVCRWD